MTKCREDLRLDDERPEVEVEPRKRDSTDRQLLKKSLKQASSSLEFGVDGAKRRRTTFLAL